MAQTLQIDMDSLWRTENELRQRVEGAPANVEARRDLAWCLMLLAMYQAGFEQAMQWRETDSAATESLDASSDEESQSAEQLLLEHLWHAHVLKVLPSPSQSKCPAFCDLGIGQIVGAPLLSAKVKSKFEDAMRRLIADLQTAAC